MSMLVFLQSNHVSASTRYSPIHYRHITMFVFFHVFLCSLVVPCVLTSPPLRVGVTTLCNIEVSKGSLLLLFYM